MKKKDSNTNDFAKMLTKFFVNHLSQTMNASRNTIKSYRDSFTRFIAFMAENKHIKAENLTLEHFTRANIQEYMQWLSSDCKNSSSTINNRVAALRSFASMLQYEQPDKIAQWQSILTLPQMKGESVTINYILPEGIKLILSKPDRSTYEGRRHFAILSLMYDSGCRVQEIADITVGNLRISCKPYSLKVVGKGKKGRIIPLSDEVAGIINSYIKERSLDNHSCSEVPLFTNCHKQKLTRAGIGYILKKYVDIARLENPSIIPSAISCHSIRHSKAMALLHAGVNLVYIRDILGHESITTTQIYARADGKLKREALERASKKIGIAPTEDPLWLKDKGILEWLKGLK